MTSRYDAYRASGVPWIGDIPSHWKVHRLKYSISSAQVGVWGADEQYDQDDVLCVRVADFDRPKLRVSDEIPTVRNVTESDREPRLLQPDDLLLEKSGGTALNPVGFVAIFEGCQRPAVSANFLTRLRPAKGQHSRYWLYAHAASYGTRLTARSVKQTTGIQNLDQDSYFNERFPYPPLAEQKAIADHLDRETAKIDTLIEEQQRLIETLRERRQAVIETSVFGGVDAAAASDNSEQWLPPTPDRWAVLQLGFVTDTLAGWAFPSSGFSHNASDVRLLRGVNIKPGKIDWAESVYWDDIAHPLPADFSLRHGDLVMGMDRPFVSGGVRVAPVSDDDLPALLLQRVLRMRPGSRGDKDYFRYVVSTRAFLAYLEPLFTGVSVPHVSEWQVRKFKMPLPALDEQRRIAAYLDEQTSKIDTLIAETERFIELSKERRAALITAAVTGQIDVGEAVA